MKYSCLFSPTRGHAIEMISVSVCTKNYEYWLFHLTWGSKVLSCFLTVMLYLICGLGFQALVQFQLRQCAVSARNALQVCSIDSDKVLIFYVHYSSLKEYILFFYRVVIYTMVAASWTFSSPSTFQTI